MNPYNAVMDGQEFIKESFNVSLSQRLQQLDDVDKKVGEIMDFTRELINNLDKDKQISRTKMDDTAKRYNKVLDEEILKVINDQLVYMEQLCVGAEHQGSMFKVQNTLRTSRNVLAALHHELEVIKPKKEDLPLATDPVDLLMRDEAQPQAAMEL